MALLRYGVLASLVTIMACSSAPRSRASSADHSKANVTPPVPNSVVSRVELPELPSIDGPVDDALDAVAAVVMGIRGVSDACGSYLELRMFPELDLGGSEVSEPPDADEFVELRALIYLPKAKAACDEPRLRVAEIQRIAVGDRVVVALGSWSGASPDTPSWKRQARVVALAPIASLPLFAAVLPNPVHRDDSEQFLPVPRMPGVGTPASRILLGGAARFEVVGEEIHDRAQGIVWQRDLAKTTLSFPEAHYYCEASRLGGHDDWRLPTALELHGIFAPTMSPPALVDRKLFSAPTGALLWTRTDDDGAWVGSVDNGAIISTHYDDPSPYGNYHVRCVRPDPGTLRTTEAWDRFARKNDLLNDTLSGLSWYLPPQKQVVTHSAAKRLCDEGSFGGFDDWHLPTVEEAFSLMSGCPDVLQNWQEAWEGDNDEVWTSMIDLESKVGATFDVCDLYRSVPLAAIFEKEGVDPKNPVGRPICVREAPQQPPPSAAACFDGAKQKRLLYISVCQEKGVGFHGPFRTYWPSGAVFEVGTYDHGVRSGPFVMYHESGGIYARGHYVKGKFDGDFVTTRPTGMPLSRGAYSNGIASGRWAFFDPDGREIEHVAMIHGEARNGQFVRYGDGGRKIVECPTRGGWEHGIERSFDEETGRVSVEFTYEDGWLEGPVSIFDSAGGLQTGQHHRGERDGVWSANRSDGTLIYRQSYRAGKLDGISESYGEKGKLTSSRRYRDGVAVGKWETKPGAGGGLIQRGDLDEEGTGTITWFTGSGAQVDSEETYVRGKRHGVWREYREGQKIRRQMAYRDGKLDGQYIEYHDNGKLDELVTYSGGKRNGLSERYTPDGSLRFKGRYVDGKREGAWTIVLPTGRRFEVVFAKGRAVSLGDAK